MSVPTIGKMVKVYVDAASVERLKCGRPSEGTVNNTLAGVRMFRRWLNERRESLGLERFEFEVGRDAPDATGTSPLVSIVRPALIHKYLADLLKRGTRPVTAMSYLNQLQQLFARWTRPYYEDLGWKIPAFPSLGGRPKSQRYLRPSSELLDKVKAWYEGLSEGFQGRGQCGSEDSRRALWFAATMMLEFGMRNGDIMRLTEDNFVRREDRMFLNYTPHKTKHSSGRMVKWPVHNLIRARLDRILGSGRVTFALPSIDRNVFDELNRIMRSFGFSGTKGAYELRKICIDHIYQRFGAEMAVSISGDDIRTISRYYADPTQPNIGEVRVVDLL